MVLERQGRKFALVQVDLFMVPGGHGASRSGRSWPKRGFSERNILISASHTHSGPGGYANFPTLNTAAPSVQTATDPLSFSRFLSPGKANPLLYTFLTQADLDGDPARGRRPRHGRRRAGARRGSPA